MTLFKGLLAALIVLLTGLNSLPINLQSYIVKIRDPSHPVQRFVQSLQSPLRCSQRVRSQKSIQEEQLLSVPILHGNFASDGWFIENISGDRESDDSGSNKEHHPEPPLQLVGHDEPIETNVSWSGHEDGFKERDGSLRVNQQLWMDEMDNTSSE